MSKVPSLSLWGDIDPTGPLHLVIELSEPWTPEWIAAVEARVDAFVAAGALGAFPSSRAQPGESTLLRVGAPVANGPVLAFALEATKVDGKAYQYLRHMIASLSFGEAEPRHVHVRERSQAAPPRITLPLVGHDNEGSAYPARPPRRSFPVVWDDTFTSKRRRVLVEVTRPLVRADFDRLADPVGAWGRMLEANAFSLPESYPDEVDCIMGQTTLFDTVTAQIEVPRYVGSEVAWDCLANLLEAFAVQQPIGLVFIE